MGSHLAPDISGHDRIDDYPARREILPQTGQVGSEGGLGAAIHKIAFASPDAGK